MAGLTILNPIHILPLSSPSSTPFTITAIELDSSPLWECELLKPLGPRAPSTSLTVPTGDSPTDWTLCDAHRRLMDILNLTSKPHANSAMPLAQCIPSNVHKDPAIPTSHCFAPPPPAYAMHSPLTSTHKTPFSSYRLRGRPTPTGKSTISFKLAAPVPRVPLASVLQYWTSHESPKAQSCTDEASCKMDSSELECEYELPDSGLGLMFGAAEGSQVRRHPKGHQHPYSHPYSPSSSHPRSQSQSRSRYSRRLRRLAPAPLQLATSTPRHTLIQGANTPKRTPASAAFVDIPLDTCNSAPAPSNLELIPDIESESHHSTQRRASASVSPSSAMSPSSQSAGPTSLVFPTETGYNSIRRQTTFTTNANSSTNTNPHSPSAIQSGPSYVNLLSWRRTVSRVLDSPLSPLSAPKSARCSVHTVAASITTSPLPAVKSASATVEFDCSLGLGLGVGTGNPGTAPPPLRRQEWVPLPQLTDETPQWVRNRGDGNEGDGREVTPSPYCADLRLDLDAEDLALRAEKCAEAIGRASFSLRSCSLLKDPEAIAELCEGLRQTFKSVQRALDGTPTDFVVDGSEAKDNWYSKHWEIIDSLNKNLNYFYLLAHQIEDRPPRIHRLAPLLDKLATYQAKFADLARKISLSHEKLRLVNLRGQLTTTMNTSTAHGGARTHAPAHTYTHDRGDRRSRRDAERAAMLVHQREIREEIRRVRGNIRAMRERHEAVSGHDENVDMAVCEEDVDMLGGKDDKWKAR